MSNEHVIVLVTSPAAESEKLACALVQEGLAACVNVVDGIRSIYVWEGKLCNESEQLLVVKSTRAKWHLLKDRVKELHPYDVPEIICLPIEDGYKPYLDWLSNAVRVQT
jgi:periplasmic divalent cation tolerance protein